MGIPVQAAPLLQLPVLSLGSAQLLAQQGDRGRIGVPIDDGLVADVARAVGVAQRLRALVNVDVRRADACDHGRLGVAS